MGPKRWALDFANDLIARYKLDVDVYALAYSVQEKFDSMFVVR